MAKKKSGKKKGSLRITLVRSLIGFRPKQRKTVRALGLKRIGQTVEKPDSAAMRGMISKVSHLVEVEE